MCPARKDMHAVAASGNQPELQPGVNTDLTEDNAELSPLALADATSHLLRLPPEIIERVAECIYEIYHEGPWISYVTEIMKLKDSEKRGIHSRLTLSSFSQVCSYLRGPVERVLYRNVQLDLFSKNDPGRSGGALLLMNQTLERRPPLALLVKSVYLEWSADLLPFSDSDHALKEINILFNNCPNITRLAIDDFALNTLDKISIPRHITSLATTYHGQLYVHSLSHIFEIFNAVEHLSLVNVWARVYSLTHLPALKSLHLSTLKSHHLSIVAQGLDLCGDTVSDLTIDHHHDSRASRHRDHPIRRSYEHVQSLRRVRLSNISLLEDSEEFGVVHMLSTLPNLQELELSMHHPLPANILFLLPNTLITLALSLDPSWRGVEHRHEAEVKLVLSLCECLLLSPYDRTIIHILVRHAHRLHPMEDLSHLLLLRETCADLKIPVTFEMGVRHHEIVLYFAASAG